MTERELMERIEPLLGRPYSEVPCRELVRLVYGFPLPDATPVQKGFVAVGDIICYGPQTDALVDDFSLAIHLGNGQAVTSHVEHGVCIVPMRYITNFFRWSVRVG